MPVNGGQIRRWSAARAARWDGRAASVAITLTLSTLSAANDQRPIGYVDLHVNLPYQHNYKHLSIATGTGQFPVAEAASAGLSALVFPLFVPYRVSKTGPRPQDYEFSWQHFEQALDEQTTYEHPGSEPAGGQVRTFYAFEGMTSFTDDRETLARWIKRGVRLFGLVHNQHNALAAAALDRRGADFGLTELGQRVVRRIYELGGIVDISHASDQTAAKVLDIAEALGKPVVATHSNARSLVKHPRNLSDALIERIAKSGGIIGINLHSAFLAKGRAATIADVVAQVNYMVSHAGVEHVGIGSDFEGDIRPPEGLASLRDIQQLARALADSGMPTHDVRAIMADNAMRVLWPNRP